LNTSFQNHVHGACRLVTTSFDETIRVWNLRINECTRVVATQLIGDVVAFDGVRIVGGPANSDTTNVWSVNTGEYTYTCVPTLSYAFKQLKL
jgi:WD40 repeat protein